jgi:TatD DNase family protein
METTQIKWIDTHCHLYAPEFDLDRTSMIHRSLEKNISRMMLPNIDLDSIPGMMALSDQFPDQCLPMMGLHPCSVKEDYQEILNQMEQLIKMGTYVGIGETGIDLYWDVTYKKEQIHSFEQQIVWAKEFDLPVIIHSRESLDLNIDIITSHQDGTLRGIFHCFSGNYSQAQKVHELGFKIGIGGVLTFKKSGLNDLIPRIPTEMIVLETDAPYLAPVPFRGKRNESSYLIIVAEKLAEYLNLSLSEVARITTQNATEVFRKKG